MDSSNNISASSLNLWGKVFDQTKDRLDFTIVIKGLAKRAIGDHIEKIVNDETLDDEESHTDEVLAKSWWLKMLYGRYSATVATAIEHAEAEGYAIQYEYTETAVLVHCKATSN